MAKTYYEFKDKTSSKFWEITVKGSTVTVRYGKIGTDGQTTVKNFDSVEEAAKYADKVKAEKIKKGYRKQSVTDTPRSVIGNPSSKYQGKIFFFEGKTTLFSEEQKWEALIFHGASSLPKLSKQVDFIVQLSGDTRLSAREKQGKTILSEMDFISDVLFTVTQAPDTTPTSGDVGGTSVRKKKVGAKTISIAKAELGSFLTRAKNIPERRVFTMVFVDPGDVDADGGVAVRALFCYAKVGRHIVFDAVGLTDSSRGTPYQHFGLISLSKPVEIWRFEEYSTNAFFSELAKSKSIGEGFDEFESEDLDSDERLKVSAALVKLLKVVEKTAFDYYYIAESDEGEYRLSPRKRRVINKGRWIEKGFDADVYRIASNVLLTADGWTLD